jgi:serine/threonine protein kinase/ABC-type branched-subunit amino acid transport system substrate-binding protein
MECPYCKAQNRDGVRYCGNCGKFIAETPSRKTNEGISNPSRSLTPGSRLQGGRYVIKEVLGQGGMGAALLAIDNRLDGKSVVIKELLSENTDPTRFQDDVRNFKREVAILAHIDHPLIPNVTDHFQEGTRYFMVQEYVEGENLENLLERTKQPMEERDALICSAEALDVLEYLAAQTPPIVHRDIKPANIIIGVKDKRAHLVDFGIARAEVVRNAQRQQTSALGTPGYAPPEQYQGNADPRSDLYALGATLHHVLTMRDPRDYPPFTYPPVRSLNARLSPEIERVLTRALSNNIDQRYQSADEMMRDVEAILQQRFGVAGSVNSYTLGVSGSMQKITDPDLMSLPTLAPQSSPPPPPSASPHQATTPTPALAGSLAPSVTPPPPSPTTPAYLPQGFGVSQPPQPQQQRKSKNRIGCIILPILLLLLVVGLLRSNFFTFLQPGGKPTTTKTTASPTASAGVPVKAIGVTTIGNETIGISDGSYIFDTGGADASLKLQAAQHLRQNPNDISTALSLFSQAVAQQSNDAEALIYQEDLRVINSGSPYVTLVVGTMLSGGSALLGVGRDDLQGAYVAQKEFNDGFKLHGGMQVRLLIANTGSKTSYVNQVTEQIIRLSQTDKTFAGVMGWPYSSRAVQAIHVLAKAHIPMVSETASGDELTGASPYFFRVAPSNKSEGIAGAQYAEQVLHAKSAAVFYDPTDPYSQSLAQDFSQQFISDGNKVVASEIYTVGKPSALPALLQQALAAHPDLIYFSGYSSDVSTILINLPPGNLPVMGGDALYELGGYPSSARVGFSRLHFTAFAYPDEWGVLGYGSQQPAFFGEYGADFDPNNNHTGSPYGFTRPDNDTILAYDATVALLKGCDIVLSGGKQTVTPQDLRQALSTINGANSFQGVSGQISFGANGDSIDKAVVVLYVDPQGHIKMEPTRLGRFLK